MQETETNSLSSLLPEMVLPTPDDLVESIRRHGLISPLIVCDEKVCDGIKRLTALKILKAQKASILKRDKNPYVLRWQANAARPWNSVETAVVWRGLPQEQRDVFCRSLNLSPSPHLSKAFAFIIKREDLWHKFISSGFPLTLLRESTHLGEKMESFVIQLLEMTATMGQKRMIAGLLKQCSLKRSLPDRISISNPDEMIAHLEALAQPRRQKAQMKLKEALASIEMPSNTFIEIDASFEQPGVLLKTRIKRNEIGKLQKAALVLESLFDKMEEL